MTLNRGAKGGERGNTTCVTLPSIIPLASTPQRESSASIMYFSRAKYLQFKRKLTLLCALCVSLFFYFRVHIGKKICSSPSLYLLPLSIALTGGPLGERLAAYFCAPTNQHADDDTGWDLFYHLGGNGPWIPKIEGVIHGTLAPPTGCDVDQVHMVIPFPISARVPTILVYPLGGHTAQSPMLITGNYLVMQNDTQHRMPEHVGSANHSRQYAVVLTPN